MTSYALRSASPAKTRADAVVVGVYAGTPPRRRRSSAATAGASRSGPSEGATAGSGGGPGPAPAPILAPGAEDVVEAYGRRLAPLLAGLGVTGRAGEVTKVVTRDAVASPLLILVGLGPRPAEPDGEASADAVRAAAGVAARSVGNAASVALALPADSAALVAAATEGFLLGGYTYSRYRSGPAPTRAAEVVLLSPLARHKDVASAFEEARVVAEAVASARDWVNDAPGDLTPPAFADAVVAAVKDHDKGRRGDRVVSGRDKAGKVTVVVRDEEELADLGCGGLLGVGSGSAAPPRLVELSYAPKGATTHLALVGKGITFDSGGLTIKPAGAMKEMKSDMAGAAAVVQATLAVAALGLPVRITAYAALAENMLGAAAMRPGDVLTSRSGTTIEVQNTDAEGRLVLADALAMAVEQGPDLILDVATLTGAMVVALGDRVYGVMGSDDVVDHVLTAARAAGEEAWPMPIPEAMEERIHSSTVADLAQHDWIRWGGGLFAAAFLREFTGGLPWAHLDIAGPSFVSGGARGHLTPGGTGVAVTSLVELCRRLAETPYQAASALAEGHHAG